MNSSLSSGEDCRLAAVVSTSTRELGRSRSEPMQF